jgi:hypothetical protein
MRAPDAMPAFHRAFGLSLRATQRVPGLIPEPRPLTPDTFLWLDGGHPDLDALPGELRYSGEEIDGTPGVQVWTLGSGGHFRMRYGDGTQFTLDAQGTHVWATWPPPGTLADTATYLLGPVLGFVLRLRGTTCLHASAVALADRAIALVGPAGAGKSTIAAAFCRAGHRVMADDVVPLSISHGAVRAEAAYAQLRLWPDMVSLLFGTPDALPRLTPTWDKRALDLAAAGCFEPQPLPLAAIYLLEEPRPGAGVEIHEVARREAMLALLTHTYVGYLLDARMRAEEFDCLSYGAATVPVRRIVRPSDGVSPSQLCARIQNDLEALGCTASPTTV